MLKDGETPVRTAPVTSDDFRLAFRSLGPARYRLHLTRGSSIEAVSSPIYLEAASGGGEPRPDPGGNGSEGEEGAEDGPENGSRAGDTTAGDRANDEGGHGGGDATGGGSGSGGSDAPGEHDRGEGPVSFTGLVVGALLAAGVALGTSGALLRRRARHRP